MKGGETYIFSSNTSHNSALGPDRALPVRWDAARAFPILAVVPGLRRMALVAIDARLNVRHARLRCLRAGPDREVRAERAMTHIRRTLRSVAPGTLILERDRPGPKPRTETNIEQRVEEAAKEEGASLLRRSLLDACEALGFADRREMLRQLCVRFPELGRRLDPSRPSMFRNLDHKRELRPLVAAFALALHGAEEALRWRPSATSTDYERPS